MHDQPPRPRPEGAWPRPSPVAETELQDPTVKTVAKVIWNALARLLHDPIGILLGSAFALIMVWGQHGELSWLRLSGILPAWAGPGSDPSARAPLLPGIPWDHEWISFAAGAFLLVLIPIILIRMVFKQSLRRYGLCLPPAGRRLFALRAALVLFVLSLPVFYLGAAGMQDTYPLYRGDFDGAAAFVVYQLGYLLFFVAIEFIFRGYLLLGLYQFRDAKSLPGVAGAPGPLLFGYYAIFISMLSYTAWHLGKPLPELWGTLVWGIAAGAVALVSQSLVFLILVHWLLNVFMDLVIWQGWLISF